MYFVSGFSAACASHFSPVTTGAFRSHCLSSLMSSSGGFHCSLVSADQVATLDGCDHLNEICFQVLPPATMSGFAKSCVSTFPVPVMSVMSPDQIGAISTNAVEGFYKSQLQALGDEACGGFSKEQAPALAAVNYHYNACEGITLRTHLSIFLWFCISKNYLWIYLS